MTKIILRAFAALSILFFYLVSGKEVLAQDFKTDYTVVYEVANGKETHVTQTVKITNLSQKFFASSYKMLVNGLEPYDFKASDSLGELKKEVSSKDGSTEVTLFFNEKTVGEGRDITWKLEYKSKEIASLRGKVLEVVIPKITPGPSVADYKAILKIPTEYGEAQFVYPNPRSKKVEKGFEVLEFNLEDVSANPITASFGKFQQYNFKIAYSLENTNSVFSETKEIALVPSVMGRQQVSITSLNPKPELIKDDKDGNLLAVYKLKPGERTDVVLIGSARSVNKVYNPKDGGSFDELPKNLVKNYTKKQKYWEVDNPKIRQISDTLKNDSITVSENAQKIYDYVTETLNYKFQKSENKSVVRAGAAKALDIPNESICMEYVDLFVAIARAMGIPAREINGFAFSKNNSKKPILINLTGGDALHSWAEYYDPKLGWIPVDPTWGSTSGLDYFTRLDTSRIAFSIKGLSSEFPLPAGAYKLSDSNKPQIDISFVNEEDSNVFENFGISAEYVSSVNPALIFTGRKTVKLTNIGSNTFFDVADTGVSLPPMTSKVFFLKESSDKVLRVTYRIYTGELKEKDFKEVSGRQGSILSVLSLILLLGLGLCMTPLILRALKTLLRK